MSATKVNQSVAEAVARIRETWNGTPLVAMILGSGLGGFADRIAPHTSFSYRDLPYFPTSTALAHKGRLVCGELCRTPVVAMQGRCHLYEGYAVEELAFPVRVMHALGAQYLIVSNASGGVNPTFRIGDLMVIEDHINLMWTSPLSSNARPTPRYPRAGKSPYDRKLVEEALAVSNTGGFPLHRGVYVAVPGPSYETRAEYRMFRNLGGDTVGMSTVPEATTAYSLGMRVLGLSVLTNIASPDAPNIVEAEDVVAVAQTAEVYLANVAESVVRRATASES